MLATDGRAWRTGAARVGAWGVVLLAACSSASNDLTRYALSLGMGREMVTGTVFQHVLFTRAGQPPRTLHVYLDGDGTPWRAWGPATDPTPRNPLVLRLMALDPAPSLYLGRPCYLGLADAPPCSRVLWTAARYSEAVVSSMEVALRRFLVGSEFNRLVWVGYSGGGTLAALLASRFEATTDLVTIAANLDIDAWTDLHGYSRLRGSLNPARRPPLPGWIRQRHYVGGRDRVVPERVVARGSIDPGTVIVIPAFDHTCCWEEVWPALLARLERESASARER